MIKPKALEYGDKVAIVSLSSGMGGEKEYIHRYNTGIERLESIFHLKVITMPNALKGNDYLYEHPEMRAKDLMDAFEDTSIKAIICMIGGDDTIRLLPYINYKTIAKNPKIFMGYSDTTANHMMLYKAGLISFHGPCVLVEFAENNQMHQYTIDHIKNTLFSANAKTMIVSSNVWTSEFLDWANVQNQAISRSMVHEKHGYEILQGNKTASGKLLGGNLSVLKMMSGTTIWPTLKEWENAILFLETGEDYPTPKEVCYFLRNLLAQGILDKINGIIVGKPLDERYYEEYKAMYVQVVGKEAKRNDLPILYNVNCSHTSPVCILPYGVMAEIDCKKKSLSIIENAVC